MLRGAEWDDLGAIGVADGSAFGLTYSEQDLTDVRPLFEPDRFLLACDPVDGQIVGVTGDFPFTMTVPGGATLDVPGVTWVSVIPTHRRRGVLRALLTAQHRRFVEDGTAVSILTASEGAIYGRFGYGPATTRRSVQIDRRLVAFRPGASNPGGVRLVDANQAREHAPDVHQRWCAHTPGALSRMDVPAALSARHYAAEIDIGIEVQDAFLGRGGRFRLRGGPDGACCEPTDRLPDAHIEIAALGSLYLGGHRALALARAGLLQVTAHQVLLALANGFATDRSPQHGTEF